MDLKQKLDWLFQWSRTEPAPQPGEEFALGVMRAIRRESRPEPASIIDQLASLFPRLAMASALILALCVTTDYCLSNFVQADVSTSAAEISEQWLFANQIR